MFPAGMVLPQEWEYKDKDPGVDIVVDDRALSYSLHKTGRGQDGGHRTGQSRLWRARGAL